MKPRCLIVALAAFLLGWAVGAGQDEPDDDDDETERTIQMVDIRRAD